MRYCSKSKRALLIGLFLDKNYAELRNSISRGADVNEREGNGSTLLMYAAMQSDLEVAKLAVHAGAIVDCQDEGGFSALHFACQNYCLEIIDLLLKHRANTELVDSYGNTPLMRAVSHSAGRGGAIKLLLGAGADRYRQNNYGQSPIGVAKQVANFDLIQFFAET
jgi:uncharacterized protein